MDILTSFLLSVSIIIIEIVAIIALMAHLSNSLAEIISIILQRKNIHPLTPDKQFKETLSKHIFASAFDITAILYFLVDIIERT